MDDTLRRKLIDDIKFETINPPQTGGQSCGITRCKQRLYSEELDITIETGYYRSNYNNRNLLLSMFESALDEIIPTTK